MLMFYETDPSRSRAAATSIRQERIYLRTIVSLTPAVTAPGATHSAVLYVFAVARAAPACQAPYVRNIFLAHVVVVGLQATCVVAAAWTSTTTLPTF